MDLVEIQIKNRAQTINHMITEFPIEIGRSPHPAKRNPVALQKMIVQDKLVSRHHCRIELEEDNGKNLIVVNLSSHVPIRLGRFGNLDPGDSHTFTENSFELW